MKGSSIHKGAEHNFKQKIQSHVDLKKADIVGVSVATLENTIKNEGLFLKREEESEGKAKVIGKAIDSTVKLAGLYTDEVAPRYQPAAVEQEQIVELPTATHDLKGILDLVDDRTQIMDIKTSSKSMTQADVDKNAQFTFYSLLHRAKTGKEPAGIVIENLVQTKEAKLNTLNTTRNMDDYTRLIARVNKVVDAINAGIYPPAHEGAWWCSENFCGYWATCQVRP